MPLTPLANIDGPYEIPNNADIANNRLDVYYRSINDFIPPGKTWETMTPEEIEKVQAQYRFDYMRPSQYQAITGFSSSY